MELDKKTNDIMHAIAYMSNDEVLEIADFVFDDFISHLAENIQKLSNEEKDVLMKAIDEQKKDGGVFIWTGNYVSD